MENDVNPNLTTESIKRIKSRIEHGIENSDDYEILDIFISSTGIYENKKYILDKFKEYDIYSYSDFVDEKRLLEKKLNEKIQNDSDDRRRFILFGTLQGVINAVLWYLDDYIKKL